MKPQNKITTKARKLEKAIILDQVLNELEKQFSIPIKLFDKYEFIIYSNRIFIMTRQVKEFEKIRAVRKGMLLAEKLGSKIKISDSAIQVLKSIGVVPL